MATAALIVGSGLTADSGNPIDVGLKEAATAPICGGVMDVSASTFHGNSTFYGEMTSANARMHEGMKIAPSGDLDRDFAQMMIPHHQGAIDMARVLLKYGRDERLRRLAQSIIIEQQQEIAYMRNLLKALPSDTSTNRTAGQ